MGLYVALTSNPPARHRDIVWLTWTCGALYGIAFAAIAVRIWKAGRHLSVEERRRARLESFSQIGYGLAIIMAGAVAGVVSYQLAEPGWIFVVPTGIILLGLVMIGKAMGCEQG
jgi:hypothetical protein